MLNTCYEENKIRSKSVMVIFGQNEIGIGQNGLYYNINIFIL